MRTGLGEQTQGLRGAAAATILDDSRWTPVLRSEAIGSAAYELGQLDGSARLARWFSWPGGGSGASDGGAGRSFTQDAQWLPADPRGPLLTAWVPLASTGSVGMFDVAPASHTDMQGAFWSTQPSTPGGGQQAGFDPYSEQPIASRYGITRGVGSGMEPGDVLFTAGWLLRSRVDELAVAAIGLSVVGDNVRGLPAPMLGRQYAAPLTEEQEVAAAGAAAGSGEALHAGWAQAVYQQPARDRMLEQLMPVLWSPDNA
jgi:hypothetical protein